MSCFDLLFIGFFTLKNEINTSEITLMENISTDCERVYFSVVNFLRINLSKKLIRMMKKVSSAAST